MARRHYINNAAVVQIVGAINSSVTSITISDASSMPATVPWSAVIDAGLTAAEEVLVTARAGAVLTVTRGYDGSPAQSHAANASFAHVAVKADYDEANAHVNAATGVHGLVGAVVGTSDTQTLTNKTLTAPNIVGGNCSADIDSAVVTADTLAVDTTSTFGGAVTGAAGAAFAGDVSGANLAAGTNGKVTGSPQISSYANSVARNTAIPSPVKGRVVFLDEVDGYDLVPGPGRFSIPGLVEYDGVKWVPVGVDTGWIDGSNIIGGIASGSTFTTTVGSPRVRRINNIVFVKGNATITSGSVVAGASGNIANTPVARILFTPFTPVEGGQSIQSGPTGPVAMFEVGTDGFISIAAVPPSVTLSSGATNTWSFSGSFAI